MCLIQQQRPKIDRIISKKYPESKILSGSDSVKHNFKLIGL